MKKAKWTIGIWGQFGDGGKIADGQAVRTTIITKEIKNRYGIENVKVVNTNGWSKRPVSFFIKSMGLCVWCRKVIIFPADNGFKVIVPLMFLINIVFGRELYYVVIGGFLPNLLKKKKIYFKMLSKFKALFVQTLNMQTDLENMGLKNIYILSNLKRIRKISESEITINNNSVISVCTFSRVNPSKGIEDAIIAVKLANEKLNGNFIHLDIYGLVDKNYKDKFHEFLLLNQTFVTYKGIVDYDKTVDVLKNYFTLLFPTFYYGEGFPGNIIDSFYSGLPIIATDWLYNKDVVKDSINGLLVPVHDPESICCALLRLYNDRQLVRKISINNLREAENYRPEKVLKEFFEVLDQ